MKILILTDHSGHVSANSLYGIVRAMLAQPRVSEIRVASRATPGNAFFFSCQLTTSDRTSLWSLLADEGFSLENARPIFDGIEQGLLDTSLTWPDVVFLRVPHPVPETWFEFLVSAFSAKPIVNRPAGIAATTSKAWLLNVPELTAPTRLCSNKSDLVDWVLPETAPARNLVLKPLLGYGGRGIVRILNGRVDRGGKTFELQDWLESFTMEEPYLAVDYLPGVSQGDKRIVIVDGHLIGAALRRPASGNWLCNVSQGGRAENAQLDTAEEEIVQRLVPMMKELGVVMCGIDTLLGQHGHRVLSEINTMSIGGLLDMRVLDGKTALERSAIHLLDAFEELL